MDNERGNVATAEANEMKRKELLKLIARRIFMIVQELDGHDDLDHHFNKTDKRFTMTVRFKPKTVRTQEKFDLTPLFSGTGIGNRENSENQEIVNGIGSRECRQDHNFYPRPEEVRSRNNIMGEVLICCDRLNEQYNNFNNSMDELQNDIRRRKQRNNPGFNKEDREHKLLSEREEFNTPKLIIPDKKVGFAKIPTRNQ